MGLRFRRTVKIAPGLRLNLSKTGVSWTLGGRGASMNVGRGRKRTTVGIPGTGLSYRTDLPKERTEGSGAPGDGSDPSALRGLLVIALLLGVMFLVIAIARA